MTSLTTYLTLKNLLRLEELLQYLIATGLMLNINNNLLVYVAVILLPDLSMIGYLINSKIGAIIYNIVHTKTTGLIIISLGIFAQNNLLVYIGLLLFAHSSIDRVLGYGLKHADDFKHTHLN